MSLSLISFGVDSVGIRASFKEKVPQDIQRSLFSNVVFFINEVCRFIGTLAVGA